MKLLLLVAFVGAASALVSRDEWSAYKAKHGKSYANIMEDIRRLKIYSENKDFVEAHNKEYEEGKKTFTVALNQFADLTTEEFSSIYNGYIMKNLEPHDLHEVTEVERLATVDWRQQGAVTPVKNQGQCGSCWSFSATGSLEGQWVLKGKGSLPSLSEQQLVDCSRTYGNNGCKGGLMDYAFRYIQATGGIEAESYYPYTARDGSCVDQHQYVAQDRGYKDIARGSESALENAVQTVGPISVAIDASHRSFQLYNSGVYYESACSSTRLDHGVLAVGYGMDGQYPYWLVKNSWGPGWGMSGYVQMAKGYSNNCGIATQASYPVV